MIKNLLQNELLQYSSYNVIELTEVGISYVSKRENNSNNRIEENSIS